MESETKSSETATQRPVLHRLAHAIVEVAISFVFAGGVLFMSMKLMCRNNHACNDFGGVAFLVVAALIAMIAWAVYLSQCTRLRHRISARTKLDIGVGVVSVVMWVALFVMER